MADHKVSIVMTAFNHEKYIKQAIDSVLQQTYRDIELIVVDDGSSDSTRRIIKSYHDERLVAIFKKNEGTSIASNLGISRAQGDWIALMSGDDICFPKRIEEELKYVETYNQKIVFAIPQLINDKGENLSNEMEKVFFTHNPKGKDETLRELLDDGNFYTAPTAFIKRELIDEEDVFKPSLLQLQDFDLWLRLAKNDDLSIMQTKLIKYRIHADNLSKKGKSGRIIFEMQLIYDDFLNHCDWKLLHKIYPDNISLAAKDNEIMLEIEKALLLLKNKLGFFVPVGLKRLEPFINNKKSRVICKEIYGFTTSDFYEKANNLLG
jgi:glycosyltransferase involved in cell wall biosynthesis